MKTEIHRWFAGLVCLGLVMALAMTVGTAPAEAIKTPGTPPPDGRWFPFDRDSGPAQSTLSLLSADANAIDLRADLPGCMAKDVKAESQVYTRLYGAGYGFGTEVGLPDLPVLRRDVETPFSAEVKLEVVKVTYTDHTLADLGLHPIYPLQPPVPKLPGAQEEPPFKIDQEFYAHGSLYPSAPVALGESYVVRGHRVLPVAVWPVAYDPSAGTVRLYREVTFRLRLIGSDVARTRALAKRYASPAFESQLAGRTLNYNQGRPPATFDSKAQMGYLVITADAYHDAMQPFVNLQESRGFDVTITKLSDIPATTNTQIKTYIQNAYDTWPIPPSYVLLVGDTDTVPGWDSVSAGEVTDLYYGCMDGSDDWHPDIGRGRFPVRSAAQTTIMVDKYLAYADLTGQEAWLKKAAFIATCDEYTIAEGTHNHVITTYTEPEGYTGIFPNNPQPGGDRLYCITHSATASNIQTSLNDGRWVVIYSGHGGHTGWEMNYGASDVRTLTNSGLFPFVASHACVTGDFAMFEVFGETWVLQEDAGALAFWGSSDTSYWDEDDVLERAMFDSLFAEAKTRAVVATMTDDGLAAVESAYPGRARYYWETYNVLGDPSVKMFLEPEQPTFTLAVEPTAHALCISGSVTSTIEVGSIVGYSGTIYLETSPLPAGITTTIEPASGQAPFTATLTLDAASGAPAGDHHVIITGTAGTTCTETAEVVLAIDHAVPPAPALLSPADGASGVSLQPTFQWSLVPQATSYRLQVCTDTLFTSPLIDVSGLTGQTHAATTALPANTCAFWRVAGGNSCGEGAASTVSGFETANLHRVFWDDVESGDGQWSHAAGQGTDAWAIATANAHSPTRAWFSPDVSAVTDDYLWTTTPFTVGSGARLTFWHRYNLESGYDGGVIEISTDGGVTWDDLGPHVTQNPYDSTISTGYSSPIGGRSAWSGDNGAWEQVAVDLSAYDGQDVQVRWRLACDSSLSRTGWYVDDVEVSAAQLLNDFEHESCLFVNVPAHFTATHSVLRTVSDVYTYTWDFGGPGTGADTDTATPTFTYTAPGGYVVQLTLENLCVTEVVTHEVFVCEYVVQDVDFVISSNPWSNAVVTFTATATGTPPLVYAWDFGDGGTGTGVTNSVPWTATHVYTAVGSYTVTLVVTNCVDARAEVVRPVQVVERFYQYLPLVFKDS